MSDTPYSANIRSFELLQRDKAQSTTIKIFRDGAQVVPTSGKYTLQKPSGENIVLDATCNIDGDGTCSITHTKTQLPNTLVLGEGYMQLWTLTISGTEYTFRRMVSLVLQKLFPVISDTDLTAVYSNLDASRPSSLSSYQKYIDDAWYTILRKIRGQGKGFEYLVTSPSAFYESHRHLALYLIFRDFHSALAQSNGRFLDLANEHNQAFHMEFSAISFIYDEDHDNVPDDADVRTRGTPTVFTSRPGSYGRTRYRRYR